jgi:hypothetical protein
VQDGCFVPIATSTCGVSVRELTMCVKARSRGGCRCALSVECHCPSTPQITSLWDGIAKHPKRELLPYKLFLIFYNNSTKPKYFRLFIRRILCALTMRRYVHTVSKIFITNLESYASSWCFAMPFQERSAGGCNGPTGIPGRATAWGFCPAVG